MNIDDLKAEFARLKKEVDDEYNNFSSRSSAHRAAIEIISFERELHYGNLTGANHLQRIRTIIEKYAGDIANETN